MATATALLTSTAGGALTNLVSAGIQRAGSLLLQKITRLKKVDKAVRDLHHSNVVYQTALLDFVTVLGTYQGKLTVAVSRFLDELEKTGLIDAIAEAAIVSRTTATLEEEFLRQYAMFLDGDAATGRSLYRSLFAAFEATFTELSQDRVVYHALVAAHREIDERLRAIEASLRVGVSVKSATAPTDFADIEPTIAKIARGLQQSYKLIRIETNRGPRKVDINKVYVAPSLSARASSSQNRRVMQFLRAVQRDRHEERGPGNVSLRARYLGGQHSADELSKFTYSELQTAFKRIVVLGDPGGGKSTMCQKLCFDLTKNTVLANQFPGNNRIKGQDQRLPLRVVLRNFEAAWVKDPQLDLFTFIERDLAHFCAADRKEIKRALEYLLVSGRAVLAFDGLDEILDTSKRQELVDRVSAFCNSYPLCPVLVTSRLVGYDDAPLSSEFEELVLEKFDEEEILEYVTKFMKVVADANSAESKRLAERFLEQTSSNAADLRRNPLMLGLMSWLFQASGDVPSNRPEIYRECSILMFERWDQRRGIMADENTDFDRGQLFVQLASEIYGSSQLTGGVSRAWLQTTLRAQFESIYESKSTAFRATKKFVDFITGRAWVMTEVGEDTYTFTHQTFLEYFFAVYLNDQHDTVASLLRSLRRRIVKYEWNEVAHLALQIKTFRSLKKQEEALSQLGSMAKQARVSKHQTAIVDFVARASEYLSPSEHSWRGFLAEMYGLALERAGRGDIGALVAFGKIAYASSERQQFIVGRIAEHITGTLTSGNDQAIDSVVPYVLGLGAVGARPATSANRRGIHPDVARMVYQKSRDNVVRNHERSRVAAGMAWGMYGQMSSRSLTAYGLAPLYNYPANVGFDTLDGLFALALQSGVWRNRGGLQIPAELCDQRLKELADVFLTLRTYKRSEFLTRRFLDPAPMGVWNEVFDGVRAAGPRALLGALLVKAFCASLYRRRLPLRSSGSSERRIQGHPLSQQEMELLGAIPFSSSEEEERARSLLTGATGLLEEA